MGSVAWDRGKQMRRWVVNRGSCPIANASPWPSAPHVCLPAGAASLRPKPRPRSCCSSLVASALSAGSLAVPGEDGTWSDLHYRIPQPPDLLPLSEDRAAELIPAAAGPPPSPLLCFSSSPPNTQTTIAHHHHFALPSIVLPCTSNPGLDAEFLSSRHRSGRDKSDRRKPSVLQLTLPELAWRCCFRLQGG